MIKNIVIEAFNFKKHKNFKAEFEAGNIYVIQGANQTGKTTITQIIKTLCEGKSKGDKLVSFGEKDGRLTGEFTGADNEKYIVNFNFSDAEEKFSIIMPDASIKKSNSKNNEIAKIFQYNDFTVDEFFGWGLTAEGRKKQATIILNLLTEKDQAKISDIDSKVNSKNGTLYLKRQELKKTYETNKAIVEKNKPTPEEEQSIDKIAEIKTQIEARGNLIKEMEERVKTLKEEKDKLTTELSTLNNISFKKEQYDKAIKEKDTVKAEAMKYHEEIETLRLERQSIFDNSNLPVKELTVNDGEAFYITPEKQLLPFVESSVSYSLGGIIITKLLAHLNKELPIWCIGKAAEYDDNSIKELSKIVKKNNGIIIMDKVVPDSEELEIIILDKTK